MAKKFSELLDKMSPEEREMIRKKTEEALRELSPLAELRRSLNISHSDLALAFGETQHKVSEMERRADMYFASLRGFIEEKGGEVEIVARLADKEIRIRSLGEKRWE